MQIRRRQACAGGSETASKGCPGVGFRALAHTVEVLLPAQRYVFALENGHAAPQPTTTSAEGFKAFKRLQSEGKIAGMVAFPNTSLIRASENYVVDPGLIMQGTPVSGALRARGIEPHTRSYETTS